jgi:DNA-binding NtrC family response regulator
VEAGESWVEWLLQLTHAVMSQAGYPEPPVHEHPIASYILTNIHSVIRPLAQVEKDTILSAMILCRGNQSLAARQLGISYSSLRQKLAEYKKAD